MPRLSSFAVVLYITFTPSLFSLSLCVYLPFLYLFTPVSSLVTLFYTLSPRSHPASHLPVFLFSPRWIIAQKTGQQTQVQIMSLQRELCCLSQERPSKVKPTETTMMHDIFLKNMSLRLRLKPERSSAAPGADFFPLASTKI